MTLEVLLPSTNIRTCFRMKIRAHNWMHHTATRDSEIWRNFGRYKRLL